MLRRQNTLWFSVILVFLMACGSGPPQSNSNSGSTSDNSKNSAVASPVDTKTVTVFNPEDFKTRAVFELVNDQSSLILRGSSKILTESAVVSYTSGVMPGNVEGLEIQFFTRPVTEADRSDVLENQAKEMRKDSYAVLLLYLDKQNRIGQVNLTYVFPGTTVTRTVAWNPDDLKKYFSEYQFDEKRLRLKSKGTYSETDVNKQTLSLAWTVDIDLPVFDRRKQ